MAGVFAINQEPEQAAWWWGAAEALRLTGGGREPPAAAATHQRLIAQTRALLGEVEFSAAWTRGQKASAEQAISLILQS